MYVTRTSLQQLLGAWNFPLSFRREALCCVNVAFFAARTLPTRRPIPPTDTLLDDMLFVCGIAPLLQADLRAPPRLELFATDASPSRAGACVAPVTDDWWRTLHNLAEEHGEHVRLNWGSSPPPLELTSSRCACAALVTPADWSVLFGYQFRAPLVKHLANWSSRNQRISCCVDSRVVLGAVSKGRSSSRRLNFGLRRLAFECLSASLSIDL